MGGQPRRPRPEKKKLLGLGGPVATSVFGAVAAEVSQLSASVTPSAIQQLCGLVVFSGKLKRLPAVFVPVTASGRWWGSETSVGRLFQDVSSDLGSACVVGQDLQDLALRALGLAVEFQLELAVGVEVRVTPITAVVLATSMRGRQQNNRR